MHMKGKRIILRAIEREDLLLLQKWANDPEIQYQLGGWHFPISYQDQTRWYETLSINSLSQRFIIDLPEHGAVGTANIVSIDWQNRNAFHGMLIGEKGQHGRGVALDALMTIMRFAFEEMELHRLDGDMIEYNEASLRFYIEKGGWVREGVKRGFYFRKGRRWDKIVVGITRADYKAHCDKINYWES